MKAPIYFLIDSLDVERGGLTLSALKQASFFANLGYQTKILTFNFNPIYPRIIEKLRGMDKLHQEVEVTNIYEDLSGEKQVLFPREKVDLEKLAFGGALEKRDDFNAYRLFKNGLYIKYIALHEDGNLHYIDYFNENRYRYKKETFDLNGNIVQVTFMDFQLNKPRQIINYNSKGEAYLSVWKDPKNNKTIKVNLFQESLTKEQVDMKDELIFKVDWLHSIVSKEDQEVVIVSDSRKTDHILAKLNHLNVAKLIRLHTNHLDKPFEVTSDYQSEVKETMKELDKFDLVLLLTEDQKQDLVKRVGDTVPIHVIPHYYEKNKESLLQSLFHKPQTDEKKAVIVSRLVALKRIDHSIKAFEKVVKTIPNATLDIWGSGAEEENLKKLIVKLKLETNVFLRGYTHQPIEAYEKALFSLMTSEHEGFGLTILESMYSKTPVISYDIKYGPNSLIMDNHNGFIVEDGNITELTEKMIDLFQNPEKAKRMGKKANEFVKANFSKNVYEEKWLEGIELALMKFQEPVSER